MLMSKHRSGEGSQALGVRGRREGGGGEEAAGGTWQGPGAGAGGVAGRGGVAGEGGSGQGGGVGGILVERQGPGTVQETSGEGAEWECSGTGGWVEVGCAFSLLPAIRICVFVLFLCIADDAACNSELDQTHEDDCPLMAGNINSAP